MLIVFDKGYDLDYDYDRSKTEHITTLRFCGKPEIVSCMPYKHSRFTVAS